MATSSRATHARRSSAGSRSRGRSRSQQVIQVFGELLITLGLLLVLYVVWELWWTNIDANNKQEQAVGSLFSEFDGPVAPVPEAAAEAAGPDYGDPAVLPAIEEEGRTFAVVYIPRFGDTYSRPVTSGVGTAVLDSLGLGHYPSTAMPGEVGNFALAGHRQTHGQVLDAIHTLVPGDKIYVQTKDGYYSYVYRNNQIVLPDRVDVIAPVPTQPAAVPTERFLTLTSCNPRFGAEERIIAYALMESWQPLSAGPPAEIAAQVAHNAEGAR
ncbi:class E sortase [Arthrobacter sp. zg-Y820]|uniref:class E sortase n=1 Tax=unclassified Arthrobacter TaxID=235627 RepID=UPI001E62184D|nr:MULTISPECIES: class E sortase [unclassified Arthrobacter]MCC9197384.1 class E sortase [Arthrobacter sp. zg-Y820]MDK1280250.1 class E sortase [Arthrobacter sp. zg.Y820]MDK1360613.1 class E sortase [Arthrobacter sp. zg-Y1219]WIB09539.1 class E sortase [Arthrobacter sp. zg-Y820]